jgi:hypothetical protein
MSGPCIPEYTHRQHMWLEVVRLLQRWLDCSGEQRPSERRTLLLSFLAFFTLSPSPFFIAR